MQYFLVASASNLTGGLGIVCGGCLRRSFDILSDGCNVWKIFMCLACSWQLLGSSVVSPCKGAAGFRVAGVAFVCGSPLSSLVYSCSGAADITIIWGPGVVSFELLNIHVRGIS